MKTILLYAAMATLLVLMTIRTGKLFIRSRKNKAMLNILALLDTEEDFYQAADTYIHTEKSTELFFYLLIKPYRCISIDFRQLEIQHNPLLSYIINFVFYYIITY